MVWAPKFLGGKQAVATKNCGNFQHYEYVELKLSSFRGFILQPL